MTFRRDSMDLWDIGDIGDVLACGMIIGDEVNHAIWGHGWVSNIERRDNQYVHTKSDPSNWVHNEPAHGHWADPEDTTVTYPPVSEEEIAEVFGLK